ncbi:hypothetical protein [Conexibacter sp. W3-3-2]|uniref:hypothetical protein n=1 Tax=Conexibacter sp. W3-3-2 TaxID=2675227 RepID=UPI001E458D88|nr:hypothetical protein [Conexibacter sp. W3-3-2]
MAISISVSRSPSTSAVMRGRQEVVAEVLDPLLADGLDVGDDLHDLLERVAPGRPDGRVLERGGDVRPVDEPAVVGLGGTQERADHARGDGLGDVGDEVDVVVVGEAVQDGLDDPPHDVLVLGDAAGGECLADELLHAVVPGRVHRDHLQALDVQRDPDVVDEEDAAPLGGEGREVARRGVDEVGAGDRPEPVLVGEAVVRAPVDGLLAAHLREQLVRGPVGPVGVVAEVERRQVGGGGGRGAHAASVKQTQCHCKLSSRGA